MCGTLQPYPTSQYAEVVPLIDNDDMGVGGLC